MPRQGMIDLAVELIRSWTMGCYIKKAARKGSLPEKKGCQVSLNASSLGTGEEVCHVIGLTDRKGGVPGRIIALTDEKGSPGLLI